MKHLQLHKYLEEQKICLRVAESCTGGKLAASFIQHSGASSFFDRGFITYSNEAKREVLNVNENTLNIHGAVSEAVALEMIHGLDLPPRGIGVATSGIAGPGGGSPEKPVGMVCFGFSVLGHVSATTQFFSGARTEIIDVSILFVYERLYQTLTFD